MKDYYEFYYNLSTAYFYSDSSCMFMDKNQYMLLHPSKTRDEEIMISLEDLERIYGPYMDLAVDGNKVNIDYQDISAELTVGSAEVRSGSGEITLVCAPESIDGVIYVPVGSLMSGVFEKRVASTKHLRFDGGPQPILPPDGRFIIAVSDAWEYRQIPGEYAMEKVPAGEFRFERDTLLFTTKVETGQKDVGELLQSFWFEKAHKIQTYSIYVPTDYDPDIPTKMVVALHGAGLGEQAIYGLSKNGIQFMAEKYNYIFVGPNACTKNSRYGNLIEGNINDPNQPEPDFSCPENPFHLSDEYVARVKLGEYSVIETVEEVCRRYNVDRDHIYLQGNSMGGNGTFYLGATYPELFRAIAPFGQGFMYEWEIDHYPEGLKKQHIHMVVGSEDFSFNRIKKTYKLLKSHGYDVELVVVGGGVHFDAWASVLEDTFRFFEKNA